ncbi:molecular chaperone [Serratia ureilytica]
MTPAANAAIALWIAPRVVFDGSAVGEPERSQPEQAAAVRRRGWLEDARSKIQSPLTRCCPLRCSASSGQASQEDPGVCRRRRMLPQVERCSHATAEEQQAELAADCATRIKLFYRRRRRARTQYRQEQLTLTKQGDKYIVNNPTPYYVTIVDAAERGKGAASPHNFEPFMVPPKGQIPLTVSAPA